MRSIYIAIFLLFTSVSIAWADLPPAKEPSGTIPCGTVPSCGGTIPEATQTLDPDSIDDPTPTETITPTPTPTETRIPARTPTATPNAPSAHKLYLPIVSK